MNSGWFSRKRRIEELNDELRSHLDMATVDRVQRGESPLGAAHAAERELGNFLLIREVTEDMWGGRWWRDLLEDVQYGLRVLWKNPRFLTAAVLTLALGIGANTALFSIVNGVLLNPLPHPDPGELVTLHESKPNFSTGSISFPNFLDWRRDNQTFSSMAVQRGTSFILTGMGDAEQIDAQFVSSNFFRQLGVAPVVARDFAAGEDLVGAAPIAMITAGFWKRKFASTSDVIGRPLTLDGKAYTVIGVVPANFDLLGTMRSRELYVPVGQWNNPLLMNRAAGLGFHGIGRLQPGVTVAQARADMERVLGQVEPFLLLLFGAVGFVLLIAGVNVANLLLARSTGRAHEFAIRMALGAGRSRILRQLLTESLLLASLGGGAGFLLAALGTKAALRMLPATIPRAAEVGIDARVLLFAAAISLLAGLAFGLLPALKISKSGAQTALKEGGRGGSGTRHRAQRALVAAEMALALVLLIGAGLMIRTLGALWSVRPGFEPKNVLTFGFALPSAMHQASADSVRAALREVHEKLAAAPGIEAVSFSWGALPLSSDDEWLFWIDGQPKPANDNDMNWALNYVVEPDYLRVMGIPLKSGRFFTSQDDERGQKVAVIDEALASKFFPGGDAVGQRLHINSTDQLVEIVGVVGHVKQWSLDADHKESLQAQLYTPFMQLPDKAMAQSVPGISVLVRSQNSAVVFDSVRRASTEMSNQQVVFGAQSMNEIIRNSLSERRFSMILLGIFAGAALLLASVGIYGVISYVVGQRKQEIGVRIALGAQRSEVLYLVLRQGLAMAALGAGTGLVAAVPLARLMRSLLFSIGAADPLTYFSVVALLMGVSLAACSIPAYRAARMNPVDALRYE
jgi:putative ABC transport system permease protein